MKRIKSIYALAVGILLLASCTNDLPTFNDKDAFIAFTSSSIMIGEDDGELKIPVLLTSLSGISAAVEFEVKTTSTAVQGTHFSIEGGNSLTFTKAEPTQYIHLKIIDNDEFGGNVIIQLELKEPGNIKLGASKTCDITIEDNEHPLLFILGSYAASADSYFASRGHFDWTIVISRDESDLNKVWVGNLDPYFAANGIVAPARNNFYGIVNADKTEIQVPVGQALGYQNTELIGFTEADPDEGSELETGGKIIISILENGAKLRIENAFGIYDDGWWNLMYGDLTITKK